jgi:hypothetical protein
MADIMKVRREDVCIKLKSIKKRYGSILKDPYLHQ